MQTHKRVAKSTKLVTRFPPLKDMQIMRDSRLRIDEKRGTGRGNGKKWGMGSAARGYT